MKKKLNLPQVLFASFFIATILTLANSVITWQSKIHSGIFAFMITIAVFSITQKIFKD